MGPGNPEVLVAVYEAERLLAEQAARGATASTVEQGAVPICIDHVDVEAEQIVLVPRVVGGAQ